MSEPLNKQPWLVSLHAAIASQLLIDTRLPCIMQEVRHTSPALARDRIEAVNILGGATAFAEQ